MLAILEEVTVRIDDLAGHTLMLSVDLDTFSIFLAIPVCLSGNYSLHRTRFGVFINAQNWQYCHYYQLCIAILYICNFLHNLQHVMLVNLKLYISGCNRITFQDCRLLWSSSWTRCAHRPHGGCTELCRSSTTVVIDCH